MILRRRLPGLKLTPEAMDPEWDGRGALYRGRSCLAKDGGLDTREKVGMRSERWVRIPPVEDLRFPEEGSSAQG